MSYDVWLEEEGERTDGLERNYTSNVAPMFRRALGMPLTELDGEPAAVVHRIVARAVERIIRDADVYRAMEPANGWGSYIGALEFLEEIRDATFGRNNARLRVQS